MKIRFAILLLALFLLSGCSNYGTEEQLMVVAFGVDLPEANQIQLTVRVPSFSGSADSGSTSSSDGYLTLTASGDTFPSALAQLHTLSPRPLNFSQTREIIVSDDCAPYLPKFLDMISRVDGIRSLAAVALCGGSARELIDAQSAVVGTRLSRYIDTTLETGVEEGYIPDAALIRIMTQTSGGYQDALLAYVKKSSQPTQKDSSQNQQSAPASSQKTDAQDSSKAASGGTQVEWMGSAAMDGPNISGILTGFETALCGFLCRDVEELSFYTQGAATVLTARLGPFLQLKQQSGISTLEIHADLNILPLLGMQIDLQQAEIDLEQAIYNLVTTLQRMRCDALGFGGKAIRRYATLQEWEQSHWKNEYAQAQVAVDVRLTLSDR